MTPVLHPRDYQIAELTRDIKLPLRALHRRHLRVIGEFLTEAWNDLMETQQQHLQSEDEPDVNALMNSRLNEIRDEKPEWSALVSSVTRGSETMSHDGSSLEKRPDLSVHITLRSANFPLTVECKLIDKKAQKGVTLYCREGLSRFIDGEYSWYAQEAFMLAYVRDSTSIVKTLTPHLRRSGRKQPDPFLTEKLPESIPFNQDLAESIHRRRFQNNPGPISIWHLWLTCVHPEIHLIRHENKPSVNHS